MIHQAEELAEIWRPGGRSPSFSFGPVAWRDQGTFVLAQREMEKRRSPL